MPVISIGNPKGGAGKTTLALVLADELSRLGAKTAVVDADPNAIIAKWAGRREQGGKNLPFMVISKPTEGELITTIDRLNTENDFVVIDLEGTASRMTSRALARSHLVLIPFNQSPIDAELAANAVKLISEESEALNRQIPYRLVRSRANAAILTKSAKRIADAIGRAELPLLDVGLVERAAYRDIFDFAATLSELAPETTSGLAQARENAEAVAQSVVKALQEEYGE
jgi:chromosome partitioning protein